VAAGGGDAGAGPPGPAGVLAGVPGTSTSWDASLGARLAGSIREACVAELGLKVGRLKAHGGGAADIEAEALLPSAVGVQLHIVQQSMPCEHGTKEEGLVAVGQGCGRLS
jgi:hypothetical protein